MYATKQNILDIHGIDNLMVWSDRNDNAVIDDGVVNAAINIASAKIDGMIGLVTKLPLSSTPELLTSLCIDVAVYELAIGAALLTDDITKRRDDAFAFLSRVASGKASLGLPEKEQQAASSNKVLHSSSRKRLFSRGVM